MTEEFDVAQTVEEVQEVEEPGPSSKRGCRKAMALLVVLTLLFSAAVPFIYFIARKSYERQVEAFPSEVCKNLSKAGLSTLVCDPLLGIVEFVPKTFSIGEPKSVVSAAMKDFLVQAQTGVSQAGCLQPELWRFSVAKSFLGWQTEVEFLFCSGVLVERTILINGKPVTLPTYDM